MANLAVFTLVLALGSYGLIRLYGYLHPARANLAATVSPASASPSGSADASSGTRPSTLPGTASSPTPTTETTATQGVLFDDFHYTGADDPALQAHGWQARSSAGGPGIENTWQPSAVSFPHLSTAQGGQALQLQVTTNGTSAGTSQAELVSTSPRFFTGSYAARIYFPNTPSSGEGGDNIVESFYLISPPTDSQQYSELDYEYMPNGGWGSTRPELDVVSWHSAKGGDRVYTPSYRRLTGWHTVQVNSIDGVTAYFLDGERITTVDEAHSLRDAVNVDFSAWLIDLSTTGSRTWDVDVNWFYYQAGKALTPESLDTAVGDYLGAATNYVNTLN